MLFQHFEMLTKFLVDAANLETLYLFIFIFYFLEIINELQNSVCSSHKTIFRRQNTSCMNHFLMVLFVFILAGQPWSLQTVFVW